MTYLIVFLICAVVCYMFAYASECNDGETFLPLLLAAAIFLMLNGFKFLVELGLANAGLM